MSIFGIAAGLTWTMPLASPLQETADYDVLLGIVRLFWAGIQIECQGATLVIDLLEQTAEIRSLLGDPRLPVVFGPDSLDIALITHLHPDHYDVSTLKRKLRPQAKVICDPANVSKITRDGLSVIGAALFEPMVCGPFTITALPAVDGLGDPQISFLVEADGVKIMHFGDTLWHGYWWKIRSRCGAPDIAFLPINGAIVQFPGMTPSNVPADLMPSQAAMAASILGPGISCPIHYGAFHNPPIYVEQPNAELAFLATAEQMQVAVKIVDAGCEVELERLTEPG